MSRLIFLGTSNSVPDSSHENAHIAVAGEDRILLIDCGGNPMVRIPQAGLGLDAISDVILTHFHPDHVSGLPLLLMDLWLLGRKRPLQIYGLDDTLTRAEKMMDLFRWANWPGFFPVKFLRLPEEELSPVYETPEWRVFSSPVCHLIPTIGLRVEFIRSGKTLAYSSDTEPCPEVVRLAKGVDVLIHEATGAERGHSSASQAGEIARQAGAKSLYLVHYPTGGFMDGEILNKAERTYGGSVSLAQDLMVLQF
jgi:ribonuclease Z